MAKKGSQEWKDNIRKGVIRDYLSLSPEQKDIRKAKHKGKGKGRKKPESWKRLMSEIMKEKSPMKGRKHTAKTRAAMSVSQKASYITGKHKPLPKDVVDKLISKANAARTEETYDKLSVSLKRYYETHDGAFKGKHHSEETRKEISLILKEQAKTRKSYGFENMSKEKLVEINRKTIAKSCSRPNGLETNLLNLIEVAVPGGYKYTGDASFPIVTLTSRMYPDFVSVKGNNKVIEAFGDYYHCVKNNSTNTKKNVEEKKVSDYKSVGYDCLVIWQSDLKESREKIIDKIREFDSK